MSWPQEIQNHAYPQATDLMNSLTLIWREALSQFLACTILTGDISQPWACLPGFCSPLRLTIVFLCPSVKKIKGKLVFFIFYPLYILEN